jgi:ABC-type long-subunit fatty acid transport system fused permease/ATPase subunit
LQARKSFATQFRVANSKHFEYLCMYVTCVVPDNLVFFAVLLVIIGKTNLKVMMLMLQGLMKSNQRGNETQEAETAYRASWELHVVEEILMYGRYE